MAAKRMFSTAFASSDEFLNLSVPAQALYFHLSLQADDDGFVNNPRTVCRYVCPGSPEALNELTENGMLITFPSGRLVIRHWWLNNYIAKDRYYPSFYPEKALIRIDENRIYQLKDDVDKKVDISCIHREEKNRLKEIRLSSVVENSIVQRNSIPDSAREAVTIPTTGEPLTLTDDDVNEYGKAYPHINAMQSVRKCAAYIGSHLQARRTPEQTKLYLERWLAKDDERAAASKITGNEGASYDIDKAVRDAESHVPTVKKRNRHEE